MTEVPLVRRVPRTLLTEVALMHGVPADVAVEIAQSALIVLRQSGYSISGPDGRLAER